MKKFVGVIVLALLMMGSVALPAQAAKARTIGLDETVQLSAKAARKGVTIAPDLPAGTTVRLQRSAGSPTAAVVKNSAGDVVALFDDAVAIDVEGNLVTGRYRMRDGQLRVVFPKAKYALQFTSTLNWVSDGTGPMTRALTGVPASYVFNPSSPPHGDRTLHDYCTASPDKVSFASNWGYPWRSVDFRGPCARHDMCFEDNPGPYADCHDVFYADLKNNCAEVLSGSRWSWARAQCRSVAYTYYTVVKTKNP